MNFRAPVCKTAFVFILCSGNFLIASAQIQPPPPAPRAAPPQQSFDSIFVRRAPEPPAQIPQISRQQREKSYAKLLEAQRYFWAIKNRRVRTQAALAQNGKPAYEALLSAVEHNPGLAEAYTALAELTFMLKNDLAEVERLSKFAIRFNKDNYGAHEFLAQVYTLQSGLSEGNLKPSFVEKAITEWEEIARLDPRNAEAWAFLSEFYERKGEEEKAIAALQRWNGAAATGDGDFYRFITGGGSISPGAATVKLGRALLRSGKAGESVALLSRAVADSPDNDEAVLALQDAIEAAEDKDIVVAIQSLKQAVLASPSNGALIEVLANTQLRAGKMEEAVKTLSEARKRMPGDEPKLIRLEATTLAKMGRVEDAVQLLRSKIVNKSKQVSAPTSLESDFISHILISNFYRQAGRNDEALGAARQALDLAHTDEATRIGLLTIATAQNSAGDFRSAETSLREVLKKDPDNATALNNLGYFLVERGERLPEAIDLIKRAVEREPDNPSFLDSLGWAHFKLKQFAEAEKYLVQAAKANPNSATIQDHLGDLYAKQGKTELAKTAWRKALKLTAEPNEASRIRAKLGEKK